MNRLLPTLSVAIGLLFTCLIPGDGRAADDTIHIGVGETEALEAKEGQIVTVHGRSADSGKSSAGTNFVNFEGAEFYLVTFQSDLVGFPEGEPAERYDDKRLAVTGVISIYQGKPQIKLTSPDQVQVLGEDEVFPPEPESESSAAEPETESSEQEGAAGETAEETTDEKEPEKPKPPVDPSKYFD